MKKLMKNFRTINLLLKNVWFVTNNVMLFNREYTIGHNFNIFIYYSKWRQCKTLLKKAHKESKF